MQTATFDLTNLGLIEISGPEPAKFLQGQLTCDIYTINEQQSVIGAHCDPKGRIQAIFRLFRLQQYFYCLLPKNLISHLLQCLQKYAVFSKTQLTDVSEHWQYVGISGDKINNNSEFITLPVTPDPTRSIVLSKNRIINELKSATTLDINSWQLLDIRAGIPCIYPETINEFTPHELNLHLIGGVSFNKGCYTGQEIIARMHYLGKLKYQMFRVAFSSDKLIPPGAKLYNANAQAVGTLVTAAKVIDNNYEALVVLQKNVIDEAIYLTQESNNLLQILNLPYTA